jgi:hypothetical protein
VEREQVDIDMQFKDTVYRALKPFEEEVVVEKLDPEDSYKSFRTGLVVSWIVSNLMLITGVTTDDFASVGVEVCPRPRSNILHCANQLYRKRRSREPLCISGCCFTPRPVFHLFDLLDSFGFWARRVSHVSSPEDNDQRNVASCKDCVNGTPRLFCLVSGFGIGVWRLSFLWEWNTKLRHDRLETSRYYTGDYLPTT